MKLIKPSVEIIPQESGLNGIYKMIELAGRTCYKSEDKITEDSAKAFVDRMIASGHGAMLEFGTVYLKYDFVRDEDSNITAFNLYSKYEDNQYSHVEQGQLFPKVTSGYVAVTTNYRVIIENGWVDDLEYLCEPTKYHEKRVCAKFITDRGVSHELVRHRVFSFAQESTRYCNYSKDKFDSQLTFIVPSYMDLNFYGKNALENPDFRNNEVFNSDGQEEYLYKEEDYPIYRNFFYMCEYAEALYLGSLQDGLTPQQARQVLPNALKTEINMCGFVSDWKHFFELRDNPKAHPDMQVLAKDLHQQFIDNGLL